MPRPGGEDDRRRWLTRSVAGIGSASLLADVGHEIPTALLPTLLTSSLGASAAALGVIEGSPTAWPVPPGWPAKRWPMTRAGAAPSRWAATPPPPRSAR
jgi:hypothetical protein